jgi:hypothetical protein
MSRQWLGLGLLLIVGVAAFVVAYMLLSGDDDDGGNASPASGTPTQTPETISQATREEEGIELSIETDEDEYEAGDAVPVRAVVRNNRSDAVTWTTIAGEPPFHLQAIALSPLGSAPLAPAGGGPPAEGTLEPGDELELEGEWDQRLIIPQTPLQAPPGRYSIQATFTATVPGVAEPVQIEAVVTFRVEGSEPVLLPLDVLGRAVLTQELKDWMLGRADNVICPYPPSGFFYQGFITNQTAAETFDFLYQAQRDAGNPICGIGTDGDAWRLNFYSQKGPEPNRFNMLFDLQDGTLLATEVPTPAPAPSPSPAP